MAAIEAGSRAARALDELYRRHGAEVYRYAYAMLGNRADAEDVTQTTFVNALRALERGESPRKPSNWLITIAHNIVRQRFRQAKSRPFEVELHEELAGAEPVDDGAPTIAAVVQALGRIPPNQREALVLREFEGRPYAEIAEVLGITTSALETLLFRARRSLAEELEQVVTCQQAEQAISRSLDSRLPRRERKRLEAHIRTCPACARFELVQKRSRRALRGLALVPIPLSLTLLKGTNTAAAASLPTIGTAAAVTATAGGGAAAAGGLAGSALALKAAAVVTAVGVAGGVGYTGVKEIGGNGTGSPRSQQVRPTVPPGQAKGEGGVHRGWTVRATPAPRASARARGGRAASPSVSAPGQLKRSHQPPASHKSASASPAGNTHARREGVGAAARPSSPPSRTKPEPEARSAKHVAVPPGRTKASAERVEHTHRPARAVANKQAAAAKKPTAEPRARSAAKAPAKPAATTPRAH